MEGGNDESIKRAMQATKCLPQVTSVSKRSGLESRTHANFGLGGANERS